jgi:S-adenosylmethionine-diacylgycerolhomoserine-N-methlytransferase
LSLGSGDETDSHAALMDDVYRHQRYFYDLTRKYYLFGRDRLIREMALAPGARVAEVGCGTARNLVRIARLYPDSKLFGLDASGEMLKSAAVAIERAGLSGRTTLVKAYAEALSPGLFGEREPFDAIIFSYSLSMIPDWRQAILAAAAALGRSGQLHIVDFGDLKGLGPVAERLLGAWLGLFHVSPRAELLSTFENGPLAGRLRLLAGRYAFSISASGAEFMASNPFVACASQAASK